MSTEALSDQRRGAGGRWRAVLEQAGWQAGDKEDCGKPEDEVVEARRGRCRDHRGVEEVRLRRRDRHQAKVGVLFMLVVVGEYVPSGWRV